MGCWGITAFESDAGLDAVDFIRRNLPEDGKLILGKIIKALHKDKWNAPDDVENAPSHTSPMALAEVLVKFLNKDFDDLDYQESWVANNNKLNKFSDITSFTASRESVQWLRNYISDSLKQAIENADLRAQGGEKWGGWFEEKDWIGWQDHMSTLIYHLDTLLNSQGNQMELISAQEQQNGECNKNETPNDGIATQVLGM